MGLATWVLIHRYRQRRERAADALTHQREMGQYGPNVTGSEGRAPLLHSMYSTGNVTGGSPPLSPLSPYADSYHSSPSSTHPHASPAPSSAETFHFPILSADGHLLPPAPASVRQVIGPRDDRPLPSPPAIEYSEHNDYADPYAPVTSSRPVVGLWPEHLSAAPDRTPSRPESPRSAASTPRLSPGLGYLQPQPQAAVYHRSFSSEGQYFGDEQDAGVARRW